MQQTLELKGRAASGGITIGPVVIVTAEVAGRPNSGNPKLERQALDAAIETAVAELAALSASVSGEGSDILAFQIAMLEDDNLRDPAHAAIAGGDAASEAWRGAVDLQIADYGAAEDDYFRARAADLRDLRNRVLRHLAGERESGASPEGAILAGDDVAPTRFLQTDWSKGGGVALSGGSPSSHVAMLARSKGVPMVVGLGDATFEDHSEAIVDGEAGIVVLSPGGRERSRFEVRRGEIAERRRRESAFLGKPAVTRDGRRIEVLVNIASVAELENLEAGNCDGIGLMRTEFLFHDGEPLPGEETQFRAYARFIEWAQGRPVTIRTLDIGGDKPVRPLTPAGERNPFLGIRGVRLTLRHRDVFRTQLRALARAAALGPLKVMVPMVTIPEELDETARLFDAAVAELEAQGKACARPPLGMMVEVPAAAIAPELFARAAFFSIGSNDLTQYVTAAARDDAEVAGLNDAGHPAVLRLVATVAAYGAKAGIPVSLCGDMAGDPRHVADLLKAGLTSLSVAPAALGQVKAAIADIALGE